MEIIPIKQITPIYDEKEDRLKLIINLNYPNRHDIWITRRFLINILDNISHLIKNNNSQKSSKNPEDKNSEPLPIYPYTKEPILLQNFQISSKDNTYIIRLTDEKNNIMEGIFSQEDLQNLFSLILKNVQFQWGLNFF